MSGAAPLPMAVTEYLGDFDIPIYQLYGMSECTGVATYNLKGYLYNHITKTIKFSYRSLQTWICWYYASWN